jgi:hypothetical protein
MSLPSSKAFSASNRHGYSPVITATLEGEHTGDAEWKFVMIAPFAAILSRFGDKIPPSSHGHFPLLGIENGLTERSPYPKSSANKSKMFGGRFFRPEVLEYRLELALVLSTGRLS